MFSTKLLGSCRLRIPAQKFLPHSTLIEIHVRAVYCSDKRVGTWHVFQLPAVVQNRSTESTLLGELEDHASCATGREHVFFAIQPALYRLEVVTDLAKVKPKQTRNLSGAHRLSL